MQSYPEREVCNETSEFDPADFWECSPGTFQVDHPYFSSYVLLRRTQCVYHCCLQVIKKCNETCRLHGNMNPWSVFLSDLLPSHLHLLIQVVFRWGQRGPPPRQSESDPLRPLHTNTCTLIQREELLPSFQTQICIFFYIIFF